MRIVTVEIRDINDRRVLSSAKVINFLTLEDANYPQELVYQAYLEAKEEIDEALLDEIEAARELGKK